ncbi:MAG: ABC transporter [Rhodobacterales bacterium]|nr:MAG: ABC transporter [Rhodobacterales bacterium]
MQSTTTKPSNAPAAQPEEKQADLSIALRIITRQLGPHKGRMALSLLAAMASVGLELVPIWMTVQLIDALVAGTAEASEFLRFGLALLIVVPVGYGLFGVATTLAHNVAFGVLYDLRKQVVNHMTALPLGYLASKQSGSVRKLIIDDPEGLEIPIAHALPEGVSAVVMWIVVSVWLFVVDWRMALVSIVLTPVSFAMMFTAMARSTPKMTAYQYATRRMNGAIGEFLAGISAVKVFRGAARSHDEAENAIRHMAQLEVEWGRAFVPLGGTFYALVLANVTLILPFGLYFYAQGTLSLSALLFFVILGGNYSAPLTRLFNLFHHFAHVGVAATELTDVLDEIPQRDTGAVLPLENTDIVFDHVRFAYGAEEVVKEVSFTAPAGAVTALVGPSGSGKSTIASLIARFFDLKAGRITIGGQDIAEMGREQLMQTVSFVFQDTFLFTGTIAENLRFARPEASQAELEEACRAAHAHDFIAALPKGYDTMIGDGAGTLSGGERQRIAIARAILKDAPIIILDEATAFADPDSEAEIQKAISAMAAGKTLVVVAHRLHSVAGADRILVLDNGELVGAGTHEELLAAGGLYARMWADYVAVREGSIRDAGDEEAGK